MLQGSGPRTHDGEQRERRDEDHARPGDAVDDGSKEGVDQGRGGGIVVLHMHVVHSEQLVETNERPRPLRHEPEILGHALGGNQLDEAGDAHDA